MKKQLTVILFTAAFALSGSVGASSSTTPDSTAPKHQTWCEAHPDKCTQMKKLKEERKQWRQEKRETWCKNHPEKCEKLKEMKEGKEAKDATAPAK